MSGTGVARFEALLDRPPNEGQPCHLPDPWVGIILSVALRLIGIFLYCVIIP